MSPATRTAGKLIRMAKQTVADRLNHISSLFHLGPPPADEPARCRVFGTNLEYPLSLIGENRRLFESCIDDLLDSFSGVRNTVSKESVVDRLIPLIRAKKINDALFSSTEADEFKRAICDLPLQKYRVLRPIFGLELTDVSGPIQLGGFRIDYGRRLFPPSTDENAPLVSVLKSVDHNQLFIQCRVGARDTTVALKLADALFYRFELVFRFLIGRRTDWVEVGIVNHRGAQMRDRIILSEEGRPVGHGSSWEGALQPFLYGDPRFPMPTRPFLRLFELITRSNNDFEKHILRCAEWTGQAIAEPNEAAALVKAAIALEVLFSANEKGVITPSFMAQISESCAFVLGSEDAPAAEIERKVKHLYGVRSSVVHSGRDSVDPKDLNEFIRTCRRVVIVLLSGEEFGEVNSMAKLADYFRERKYASLPKSQQTTAKTNPPED